MSDYRWARPHPAKRRSWHAIISEPNPMARILRGDGLVTYCGCYWAWQDVDVDETLPGNERSCETCLRLIARERDGG